MKRVLGVSTNLCFGVCSLLTVVCVCWSQAHGRWHFPRPVGAAQVAVVWLKMLLLETIGSVGMLGILWDLS